MNHHKNAHEEQVEINTNLQSKLAEKSKAIRTLEVILKEEREKNFILRSRKRNSNRKRKSRRDKKKLEKVEIKQ
jgi:hypothetical protein